MNTEAITECGGSRVETTEQRRSLKVICERDVAEQAYHSVTLKDQSPQSAARLFSDSLCSITPQISLFLSGVLTFPPTRSVFHVTAASPAHFWRFYFIPCATKSLFSFPGVSSVNLSSFAWRYRVHPPQNTAAETVKWGQWCTINSLTFFIPHCYL